MSGAPFRQLWPEILEQCQLEQIPRARLHLLAAVANRADMRFLLKEAERIEREWAAIRGTDAGDVSDDYWRMAMSVSEVFKLKGSKSVAFLTAELLDPNSPHRVTAARQLQAAAAHVNREELNLLLAKEADPDVRAALQRVLEPLSSSSSQWWQFWRSKK